MRVLRAPVLGLRALPSPLATPLATVTRIASTSQTFPPHSLARGIHTTLCSAIHRAEAGDKFGPGHHQPHIQKKKGSVTPEERERVLERTRNKVDKVTEWARVVVYDGVERAHGRLTPGELRETEGDEWLGRVGDEARRITLAGLRWRAPQLSGRGVDKRLGQLQDACGRRREISHQAHDSATLYTLNHFCCPCTNLLPRPNFPISPPSAFSHIAFFPRDPLPLKSHRPSQR